MAFPVKWYSSAMQGAPMLGLTTSDGVGTLISLLKAVLVTGFGSSTIASLAYSAAQSTITATVSAGHKYQVDSVIKIEGANESGFNGEFRVVSVTSSTVSFGLDNGTPSSSSATGTLIISIPSLGWAVEFEDATNKLIVFKRTDPLATPLRLRIDNSAFTNWNYYNACYAKAQMVEGVADVNTFTTVIDTKWPTAHTGTASPDWFLFGDSLLFHFTPSYGVFSRRYTLTFGDILSVRPGDNYHCIMSWPERSVGASDNNWLSPSADDYPYGAYPQNNSSAHRGIARSYHQLFGYVPFWTMGYQNVPGAGIAQFPNPADNGFYFHDGKIPLMDDKSLRGFMVGMKIPLHYVAAYDKQTLKNLPYMPGELLKILLVNAGSGQTDGYGASMSMIAFDMKGPWR